MTETATETTAPAYDPASFVPGEMAGKVLAAIQEQISLAASAAVTLNNAADADPDAAVVRVLAESDDERIVKLRNAIAKAEATAREIILAEFVTAVDEESVAKAKAAYKGASDKVKGALQSVENFAALDSNLSDLLVYVQATGVADMPKVKGKSQSTGDGPDRPRVTTTIDGVTYDTFTKAGQFLQVPASKVTEAYYAAANTNNWKAAKSPLTFTMQNKDGKDLTLTVTHKDKAAASA